jgi:hypothetical protein
MTTNMAGGKGKRKPLSAALQIVPLDHIHARRPGKRRRRIGAIVRNDQHPHIRAERLR